MLEINGETAPSPLRDNSVVKRDHDPIMLFSIFRRKLMGGVDDPVA
jgi:hypothetical protein